MSFFNSGGTIQRPFFFVEFSSSLCTYAVGVLLVVVVPSGGRLFF
jgi:hypothetical protein